MSLHGWSLSVYLGTVCSYKLHSERIIQCVSLYPLRPFFILSNIQLPNGCSLNNATSPLIKDAPPQIPLSLFRYALRQSSLLPGYPPSICVLVVVGGGMTILLLWHM